MTEEGAALLADLLRFKPDGLSANGWAVMAGVNRTIWTDIRRHGNPSRRILEKLLGAAGSSLAEFEALRIGTPPAAGLAVADAGLAERMGDWRRTAPHSIPVYPTMALAPDLAAIQPPGAFQIDPTITEDRIDCPPQLGSLPGLYAVTSANSVMWPRFREGRRLIVAPSLGDRARIGDDVLVQLSGSTGLIAVIAELASRDGGGLRIHHFTPERQLALNPSSVAALHRVVGEVFEG